MKRNIKKKVMAGSMAVVMAAGLAGTYSYQNGASEVHAEEETKELTEAAENVLKDSDAGEQGGFSKEESVYVKADASGKISETTVTEWLKNPEKGNVEDTSELNDIKNIKGDEKFTEGKEGELSWKSEGDDIYYQGTTDKELPVDVKVSYKLDGKEIAPEDLEGKDGKVEIRFDYENKSKEIVEVNGENVEMYTPFTMVTAMMLPTDEYKNVTIDNGKIISDADKDIVVGVALPGLEENLNLENLDVDIPDSLTITADVKDVSVGPTITLASAEIMSDFNLDDVDSFDDLQDSIDELEDAAGQLVDGSQAASDGASQLADGSKTLADGVNTLNDKSGDLISGVNSLANGVGAYTGGVKELYEGSTSLTQGAEAVNAGANSLSATIGRAKGGAGELKDGAAGVKGGMAQVSGELQDAVNALGGLATTSAEGIAESAQSVLDGVTVQRPNDQTIDNIINTYFSEADDTTKAQVRNAINEALEGCTVNAGASAAAVNADTTRDINATVEEIKAGIQQAQAALTSDQSELVKGVTSLENGAANLEYMLGTGDGSTATIGSGAQSLAAGTQSLTEGASALEAGAEQLYNNSAPLMAGVTALKDGGSQLAGGVGQLADGAAQVSDGANTLAQGNQQLAEGMSQFKSEGIDKLTETFNGDIQNAIDRIDAMSNIAKNYKSFAGIKDGVSGKTKFVIETEGVD